MEPSVDVVLFSILIGADRTFIMNRQIPYEVSAPVQCCDVVDVVVMIFSFSSESSSAVLKLHIFRCSQGLYLRSKR